MLVAFGLWILLDGNIFFTLLLSTDDGHSLTLFSHLLLVAGSITVFTGLLGCLGSLHEIRCLIAMYMGLLILLLGLQSTILVLLNTRQELISVLWETQMDELISTYGNKNLTEKEPQWAILDDFQNMEHCCGRHNITDWKFNKYKEHASQVPCSCTTLNTKQWFCDSLKNAIYIKGCEEDIKTWFKKNIWVLISISSGLLSVEVLQFLIAAWMFKQMNVTQILPKN